MARLRILHAPGYGPRATKANLSRILNSNPTSAGTSESGRIAHLFGTPTVTPGYEGVVGFSPVDTRRARPSYRGDAGDNPMLVRAELPIHTIKIEKLTDPGRPLKLTPERWGYAVRYEWNGQVVRHINMHMSIRVLHPWRWRREWNWLRNQVVSANRRGDLPVVTGDLNTGRASTKLRKLGLIVWRIGVDYVAWSHRLGLVKSRKWTPPNVDHPWMLAVLHDPKEEA